MRISAHFTGTEKMAKKLKEKSATDYKKVSSKNLNEMRNRAVGTGTGGTPRDTGELRLSASVDLQNETFGYTKDYAPHVEHGHRTRGGGFVPGQKYLAANAEIQKPIFRKALKEELKK